MYLKNPYFLLVSAHYLFHLWICELQVNLSGYIELNTEPKPDSGQNYSVCHLNLNRILAHEFSKISLLSAYNVLDIRCLSKTYLDSSNLPKDLNLEIQGYRITWADDPSNVRQGECGRSVFIKKIISP